MVDEVERALRSGRLLEPGQRVGVAVSGGADSIALLNALHALSAGWRFQLTVLHVNYGTRGADSDADEQFVRRVAAEMGLKILVYRPSLPSGNFEQTARDSRYGWFREVTAAGICERVAVGHTRSDQAETVLSRFLRGSGTSGLAAIRPAVSGGIVRPLLGLTRAQVRGWLAERRLSWREDGSNADVKFARNRIRHELLPMLTRDWNPALTEVLAQTAEWARAEEEYWADEVRRLAERCLQLEAGAVILSARPLAALPLAAARRVVRFAISHVKGDLRQIDFSHVEGILALAHASVGRGRLRIPGLVARRSFDWVRLAKTEPNFLDYRQIIEAPGEFREFAGGPILRLERKKVDSVYNDSRHQLDWGLVSGLLELRNWRPGDHYTRAGHTGDIKLKHLFQEARIPFWERQRWPVIARENAIVWTRRFGPAAAFVPSTAAGSVLVIREIPSWFDERANQIASL